MYNKFNKTSVSTKGLLIKSRLFSSINNNNNNKNSVNNVNNVNNVNSNSNIEIPTFNILIATIGRDSLETLLESLSDQLTDRDCITIVFDNNTIRPLRNSDKLKCKLNIYNEYSKF